jgi:hypothetical protein
VLSIVARPAIRGSVPAFLFDAPTPGTGKSLAADATCMIATGRAAPRGTFPSKPEELEKVLSAYALRSAAVIGFDNIDAAGFGGAALDKVLTAVDTVDLRILGKTEIVTMKWRAVILASGNNVAVHGDTVRRVLVCRLESTHEKPEERDGFRHAPLLPWILRERPRLVRAALTVLRAYQCASPDERAMYAAKPWGSYESFTEMIVNAIIFAGGANVLDARPTSDIGGTDEREAIAIILHQLPRLDTGSGVTARELVRLLYERDAAGAPDGFDSLREAIETLVPCVAGRAPDAKKLGAQLRRFLMRVVGGRRLVGAHDRTGVRRWQVEDVASKKRVAGSAASAGSSANATREGNGTP